MPEPAASLASARTSPTPPPTSPTPIGKNLALIGAALSGTMYCLAFAGMDIWPLAFVAFVPLRIALDKQPPKRALLIGLVSGLAMNIGGFYWLMDMLKTFSGFGVPLCMLFFLILCTYQAGRFALFGWLFARTQARGWPANAVFLAAFAASELVYPLLFPWYFAATVHKLPIILQTADLGGPILVGVVVACVSLAIAEPILARLERRKPRLVSIAAPLGATALGLAYGAARIPSVDAAVAAAPAAKVGMVQANMGLFEKRENMDEGLIRHFTGTQKVREQGADFVVWSETSAMRPMRDSDYERQVQQQIGRRLGMPAIVGAVLVKPDPDPRRRYVYFNSALSTDASGHVDGRYDKEFLLAFGEYLPFGDTFPALYEASPNSGRFSAGKDLTPLTIELQGEKHAVTPLICYEDILPGFTNRAVAATNPDLLVNITNDAWFGKTTEPWEHLALAKLRAIEHRRYLVRSTNSGVSAVVDPVGRVVTNTDTFEQATAVATIHWLHASTLYEKVGDIPWYIVSLGVFAAAFVRKRDRASGTA